MDGPVRPRRRPHLWLMLAAALLGAAATPAVAAEVGRPGISRFTPQGSVKQPREAVARFGTPMVALGATDVPAPFDVVCPAPGDGQWVDPYTWTYRFRQAMPGGLVCSFLMRSGLYDLAGRPLPATDTLRFDTGGPMVRASLPADGARGIDENQVFLLHADALPDPASLAAHLHCVVPGIEDLIPAEVLTGAARDKVLGQRRALGYRYRALLFPDRDAAAPLDAATLAQVEARLLAVRCARTVPPDSDVHLLWEAGMATSGGQATTDTQRLSFRTRPAFMARLECERVNARRGCLPLSAITLRWTAPVSRAAAAARVYLQDPDGERIRPDPLAGESPWTDAVRFAGPFQEQARYTVHLPQDLTDDAGRVLENRARFPLETRTDAAPPLVKFAGTFGIVESGSSDALVPVTVRAVEAPLPGKLATPQAAGPVPGRQLKVSPDNAAISTWLRRVEDGMATRGDWQRDASGTSRWHETTGDAPVLAADAPATPFSLPRADGPARFEVLGIALPGPGLHVVEIASPALGAALLGREAPRYVATAVLVTNLAVHFKWGGADSLVWVTTLDGAQPVAGAALTVSDHCTGNVLWRGVSGADGSALIGAGTLPAPSGATRCYTYPGAEHPLLVSARAGAQLGLALSAWHDGIEPWAFNLPSAAAQPALATHTVLDRALLRPGETLSMKHYLRQQTPTGFALPPRASWPDTVELRHQGSDEVITQALALDAGGIALGTWVTTPDTRPGTWDIRLRQSARPNDWAAPSAQVRVESFRVPTLEAVLQAPAGSQVAPRAVTVDAHLRYLSGGAVAGAPVRVRAQQLDRGVRFDAFDDFSFDGAVPVPGVVTQPGADIGDAQAFIMQFGGATPPEPGARMQEIPLTLDGQGSARTTLAVAPVTQPQTLRTELEYTDLNGDRRTTARDVPLWPAGVLAGVRTPDWRAGSERLTAQVVTANLDGSAHPRAPVSVQVYARSTQSYRRRLAGGFYGWDGYTETRILAPSCSGHSDAQGRFDCTLTPGVTGEVILAATTRDAQGRSHTAITSAWVYGRDEQWFGAGDADRMDLVPEQREVAPGGRARVQVRMPFRSATALVTVEREGVLRRFVTPLSGRNPVIEVPIEAHDAPNVYVSVLAVRGRLAWWRSALASAARAMRLPWRLDGGLPTARLDLGKPAWKLGVTQLRVGWAARRLEVTVKPSAEVYGVRERAPVDIEVRRADGGALPAGAEIAVAAVDEGLLALRPNPSWALLDALMRPRGIGVWTATAQMQVVGKRHYGKKAAAPGGGGGAGPAREVFDTLLLWRGRVPLDAAGRARVTVPLNDTLGAFRVAAVASAGLELFGTGSAVIRTSQDLMLHAGLPPLVRAGDRFNAGFTVRNASAKALTATVRAGFSSAGRAPTQLPEKIVDLGPGAAQTLTWPVSVPDGARLDWQVRAGTPDKGPTDTLRTSQTVLPLLPVRTVAAALERVGTDTTVPVALPSGADPARGGIAVGLLASLADGLPGVRRYMQDYPYRCLEQSASVAVALDDRARWDALMAQLPRYLDRDGLARYFVSDALSGSEVLSAYLLGLAHATGWPLPDGARVRLLAGLRGFVEGRIARHGGAADFAVRRVAAMAALAQAGALDPAWVADTQPAAALWPVVTLLDWREVIQRLPDSAERTRRLGEIEAHLRSRLDTSGTRVMLAAGTDDLPWLMVSPDLAAARLLAAVVDTPAWQPDRVGLARGLLARLDRGHWDTTPANAWGALALRRFGAAVEPAAVEGATTLALGEAHAAITWPTSAPSATLAWPPSGGSAALRLRHAGAGMPWATVEARAAVPTPDAVDRGYAVTREVLAVSQHTSGVWIAGDVVRVRVTVAARAPAQWVVVEDPLPPGAQLLDSGLAGDASLLAEVPASAAMATPVWVERRPDAVRAFYQHLPRGPVTYEYTLRLNTAGRFALPPTHVEAMYAPDVRGDSVSTVLEVAGVP